jgi:hypothetical protein
LKNTNRIDSDRGGFFTGRSSQMSFFKKFGKTMRILESEAYKGTIKSTERLAEDVRLAVEG